jgi:hypothetical protein
MTNYVNPSTRSGGVEQIVVPERSVIGMVDEAPFDDQQHVRVNGEWVPYDAPPIVPDTLAPSPPTSLSGSGTIVSGGTSADYELTWVAPTTNTDASPLTDFAYYVVHWRYAGTGPWATFVTNDTSAALPGLVLATNIEWEVLARDTSGNDSTWATNTITGLTDTAGPEQPSVPSLSSRLGTITMLWDGLDHVAAPPADDFDHLDVFMSATTGGPWTYVGRLSGAGAVIVADVEVGQTRFVTTIAVDTSGNTSVRSAESEITVQGVTGPDIEANAITANDITSGSLSAAVTITGYLLAGNPTGSRVIIDGEGIRQYDDSGNLLTNIPTDPDQPATFEGSVIADSITVKDFLSLQGLANKIARGAVLALEAGTGAPSQAPSVAIGYATYDPARWSYLFVPVGVHANADDSPDITGVLTFFGYGKMVGAADRYYEFSTRTDSAGTLRSTYGNFGSGTGVYCNSAERLVSFGLRTLNNGDVAAGSMDSWDTSTMNSSGTSSPTVKAHQAMTADSSTYETKLGRVFGGPGSSLWRDRMCIAVRRQATDDIVLRQYTVTDSAFTIFGTDDIIDDPFSPFETLIGVTYGSSAKMGFPGADQSIWLVHGSVKTYAYNSSGSSRLTDFDFPTPSGAVRMYAFGPLSTNDFLGFRTTTWDDTTVLTKLTNNHWVTGTSDKWWVSTVNFDSDVTGGTHESLQGPRASLTMKKRAGLEITVPAYPVRPSPTTTDDPLSAKIFLGRGASDPGRTYMEYVGQTDDPNRTIFVGDFTFPAGLAATPPLATSTFTASSPGRVTSSDGAGWVLSGDGKATLAGVEFDSAKPGFTSSVMAHQEFKNSTTANVTSTSSTAISMGTDGGSGTFVAPPSGRVTVIVTAQLKHSVDGQYCAVGFEVRTGVTIGSGTVVHAFDVNDSALNRNTSDVRASQTETVSGLTPGDTYNIRCMTASQSATGTAAHGRLYLIPSP